MNGIKTALVLGGGGSRGAYEIGVWQALREMGIPIDIVTGTSVGAINGAIIAQDSFDLAVNLWKELDTSMVFDVEIKELISNSGIGSAKLKALISEYIKEESVRNSHVDYGLVTVSLPSMTPQFLTTSQIPEGKLIDYILASSTLFPAMKSYEIDNQKLIDGGFSDNLPVGMALDRGATHIIAVDLEALGIIRKKRFNDADFIKIIQCPWDLGNFMIFNKENSKKIMRLGYLDTLKSFNFYEGTYFCFAKGEFEKKYIDGASMAGVIFDLSPEIIYKKFVYDSYLKKSIEDYMIATKKELDALSGKRKSLLLEGFIKAKATFNQKTITLTIGKLIKENDEIISFLMSKHTSKLFKNEIAAANYLIKEGLI